MAKIKKQKDKQRSTNFTHKTNDRVTQTPLRSGVNSAALEGYAVPAPLVPPVVLPCYDTSIVYYVRTQDGIHQEGVRGHVKINLIEEGTFK